MIIIMRTIELGTSGMQVPVIAIGCMRIKKLSLADTERLMRGAMEQGANFFDHADIYSDGESEAHFAKALGMNEDERERVILQSKCGIRDGWYDFSREHILKAVEGSLRRLQTDYLDVLLLHRPDPLVEPGEVAEAFDILHEQGKVRWFGVSNQNPGFIRLLQKHLNQPLVANQLQFGLGHTGLIDQDIHVNMDDAASLSHDGGILNFCRLQDLTIQTWSPLLYGYFEGMIFDKEKFPQLNAELEKLAEKHGVTPTAIAFAWILRHPAGMQAVTGTTSQKHQAETLAAADIALSREEWYALYRATGISIP